MLLLVESAPSVECCSRQIIQDMPAAAYIVLCDRMLYSQARQRSTIRHVHCRSL
jgi:hypothetical protein